MSIKLYHTSKNNPTIEYECNDDIGTFKIFTDDELKYYVMDYYILYESEWFRYAPNLEQNCIYKDNNLTINIKPFNKYIDILNDSPFEIFVSDDNNIYYIDKDMRKDIIEHLNNNKNNITLNIKLIYNKDVFNLKYNIIKYITDDNMVSSFMPQQICVKNEDYKDSIKNAELKPSAFNDQEEVDDYIRYISNIAFKELVDYKVIK